MSYDAIAVTLTEALGLDSPPIALAFVDAEAGRAISGQGKPAPSACSFWRNAETGVFYAPAEAHFNCPVGAMVMGFDLPKAISDELMELVGTMGKCGYISADEPGHIPTSKARAQGIIYGPLAQFPMEPHVVLCWLTPFQAMIWNEANGGAVWKTDTPGVVLGRPACAALPASIALNGPVMSLGCIGMRTFTEVAKDRLLAAVPGSKLLEFSDALASMRHTNDVMASFYVSRKDNFAKNA
jgi:uncharacterized protein (DUF169 family)